MLVLWKFNVQMQYKYNRKVKLIVRNIESPIWELTHLLCDLASRLQVVGSIGENLGLHNWYKAVLWEQKIKLVYMEKLMLLISHRSKF